MCVYHVPLSTPSSQCLKLQHLRENRMERYLGKITATIFHVDCHPCGLKKQMGFFHSAGGSIKNRFTQTACHYIHGQNPCHPLYSKPKTFSQDAADTWSQNDPSKDNASLKPALGAIIEETILIFSRLSAHGTPRKGSFVQLCPVHWSLPWN